MSTEYNFEGWMGDDEKAAEGNMVYEPNLLTNVLGELVTAFASPLSTLCVTLANRGHLFYQPG
jgi:hypothetical protein